MKKLIMLFFSILCASYICAQKVTFYDSSSQHSIPFVFVSDGKESYYTDEFGNIYLSPGCTYKVKHVAYNDTIINYSNNIKRISLKEKHIELPEVAVHAGVSKGETEKIGFTYQKSTSAQGGKNGYIMALYIPYNSDWVKVPLIHAITADLSYDFTKIKNFNIKKAILRFDIRKADNRKNIPCNESLLDKDQLYYNGSKTGKKTLALKTPITFPKEGIYVTIEWISPLSIVGKDILEPSIKTSFKVQENVTLFYDLQKKEWKPWEKCIGEKRFRQQEYNGQSRNIKLGIIIKNPNNYKQTKL